MTDSGYYEVGVRRDGTVRQWTSRGGLEPADVKFMSRVTEELPRIREEVGPVVVDSPTERLRVPVPTARKYAEPSTTPGLDPADSNPWFQR